MSIADTLLKKHGLMKDEPDESDAPKMSDDSVSPDEEDAAQDLIDALRSGDAKGVVLAYKDLEAVCSEPSSPMPPDSSEPEPDSGE